MNVTGKILLRLRNENVSLLRNDHIIILIFKIDFWLKVRVLCFFYTEFFYFLFDFLEFLFRQMLILSFVIVLE